MTSRQQCLLDTAVVIAGITLVQAQARSATSMEREDEYTITLLAVESLAIVR